MEICALEMLIVIVNFVALNLYQDCCGISLRIIDAWYRRWKLWSGNLHTSVRPNQKRKMQL